MSGGGSRLDDPSKEPWPRWRRPSVSNRVVRTTRLDDTSMISNHYRIDREPIGKGSFGVVHRAVHLQSEQEVAIKIVVKAEAGTRAVHMMENELTILRKVEHPSIVSLQEVFETHQQTMMVLEFCGEGDLETVLKKRKHLTNEEAKVVMTRLCSAVAYMHDNKMVHRDLKLENILLKSTEGDPWDVKVTDFGLSCMVEKGPSPESRMQTYCGTPSYMAPEVLESSPTYTKQCDVWSLGVIMFKLLSGMAPFHATTTKELAKEISKKTIDMSASIWMKAEREAKELLLQMLEFSPAKRISAQEVSFHPWITGRTGEYTLNVLQMMSEMSAGDDAKVRDSAPTTPGSGAAAAASGSSKPLSPQHPLRTAKTKPDGKSSTLLGVPNGGARPLSGKKSSSTPVSPVPVPNYMQPTRSSSTSAQAAKQQRHHVTKASPAKKP